MKKVKKFVSLVIVIAIVLSLGASAYAKSPSISVMPIEPMDGMSYAYDKTDPSINHKYGPYGSGSKGNVILPTILANLLIGEIAAAILPVTKISADAQKIASMLVAASTGVATTSTKIYYKVYTARNTQLPGFYQKLLIIWYTDSTYTKSFDSEIIYRYKA